MNQADMSDRATYIKAEIAATSSIGYLGAGEGAWVTRDIYSQPVK